MLRFLFFNECFNCISFASLLFMAMCCFTTLDSTPALHKKKKDSQKTESHITKRTPKKPYQKKFNPKKVIAPPKAVFESNFQDDLLLKKTIRDMSIEELRRAKKYAEHLGDKELILKYAERLLLLTNDQEELRALRLEIADLYFDKGDFKNARKAYHQYTQFYGEGSKEAATQLDYALYKTVLCRFYARLKPPLDQTATRKTISLANHYLDRTSPHKKYVQEINSIRKECYTDLCTYEVDIVNQYLNLDKLTAAQTRLESIKEEFIPVIAEIEPKIIELEGLVAQRQGKKAIMIKKAEELSEKFPEYKPTLLVVHGKPNKTHVTQL